MTIYTIIILTILRHIYLTKIRSKYSSYILMFILSFILSFIKTKNLKIGLLISLLTIAGRIIYRYNINKNKIVDNNLLLQNTIIFVIGLQCIFIFSEYFNKKENLILVNNGLFYVITYLVITIFEWLIHYYIMHCYQNWKSLLNYNYKIFSKFQNSCKNHNQHHSSVNDDMSIKEIKDEGEILFSFITLFVLACILLPILFYINKILNLNKSFKEILYIVIFITVFFGFMWNYIHPLSHNITFNKSTKESPSKNNTFYDTLIYKNHKMHHIIKGKDKGNYNVIFLGADELFNMNKL